MTNEYIFERIEELTAAVDPLNIDYFFEIASNELKSDFYKAAKIKPGTHEKGLNEGIFINTIQDLLICYFSNFDVSDAKTSESGEAEFNALLEDICLIVDLIFYKGIPYKELSQYELAVEKLSSMYHKTRVDLDYIYLNEYCQSSKITTYGAILVYLASKKMLRQAISLYKKHSFYISSNHLIDTFARHFSDEDINNFDKTTCEFILLESEKANLDEYYYKKEKQAFLGGRKVEELSQKEQDDLGEIGKKYGNYNVVFLASESYKLFSYFKQSEEESVFTTITNELSAIFESEFDEKDCKHWHWIDLFFRLLQVDYSQEMGEDFYNLIGRESVGLIKGERSMLGVLPRNTDFLKFGSDYRTLLANIFVYLNKNYERFIDDQEFKLYLINFLDHYKNIIDITGKRECSIDELGIFVDKVNERNEQLNDKLIGELIEKRFKSLSQEDIDENCKLFFDMNKDELNNQISSEKSQLIIAKLNSVPTLKKIIATGEIMFLPYAEIDDDLISGDFTGLVVSQIKAVERYLKETIIRFARNQGKNILIDRSNRNSMKLTRYIMPLNDTQKILVVGENTNSLDLSQGDYSVEIGPCIIFIKRNLNALSNVPTDSIFTNDLYDRWVSVVRNRYMHVVPIDSLSDAKEKLAKTSYWLLRVIDELKI